MLHHVINSSVIPYFDGLACYGIHCVDSREQINLKKLDWPHINGHRKPTGGSNDTIHSEKLSANWKQNELWFNTLKESSIEARRMPKKEIDFFGWFYAQVDGDVAYVPENNCYDFLIIFCGNDTNKQTFHAIKFAKDSVVILDAFLIHSLPIPIKEVDGIDNFTVFTRAVNAKSSHLIEHLHVHIPLTISERKHFIPLKQIPIHQSSHEPTLSWKFSQKYLNLEHATHSNLADYGSLVSNFEYHKEKIEPAMWPYLSEHNKSSKVGLLEQEFSLTWRDQINPKVKASIFEGLSASIKGATGKPGIEYHTETNEFIVNLLIAHPDGSYYIHPKENDTKFATIVAMPDPINGDPIEKTVKVFLFQKEQALRLRTGVWHSLPILIHPETARFREVVCETNAFIHIDIPDECEDGLKFKYFE